MKHCPNCNNEIPDDAKFCPDCGMMQPGENPGPDPHGAPYGNRPPYGFPPPPPPKNCSYSVLSIIGFALSFFLALPGLIVSIIAYNDAKAVCNFRSMSLSKAGIIISIIYLAISVLVSILFFVLIIVSIGLGVSYSALPLVIL